MRVEAVLRRIERRLAKLGLTEYSAAVKAGLSKDAIRNMRRTIEGKDRSRRGDVAAKTVEALAPVLETTPEWLMWEVGPEEPRGAPAVTGLPVVGRIQAGNWLDITIFDPEADQRIVAAPRDPRFPRARHYCLEVVGDSVDRIYPEGTIVVCVDFAESGLSLKSGQFVHVERRRGGGQMVEITLKEVLLGPKRSITLLPRSSNPAHQPVHIRKSAKSAAEDDGTEVLVRGIVVSGITPAPVV